MEAQDALNKIQELVKAPEVPTEVSSKQYALNWKDILRGLLVAVGASVFTVVDTSIEAGDFHFNWALIGKVAAASALAYLAKNFLQPAQMKTTLSNQQVEVLKTGGADSAAK